MNENIKYIDFPQIQNGMKPTLFYANESLPTGFSIQDISELVNKRQKIPYVEGKSSPPAYEFYPIIAMH